MGVELMLFDLFIMLIGFSFDAALGDNEKRTRERMSG